MILQIKNIGLSLLLFSTPAVAGEADTSWSLTSPDGGCSISVALDGNGSLSYQVSRAGEIVIPKSPLGLLRDDQDFEHSLTFDQARENREATRKI